ncbi:Hypothetical protein, putative [Bodo saltans]|uniref:Uncharacterized protein n=1 Tax=Bodo saltans TaxID=75058 RepID=A0A0S4IZZ1_BODSA|nr:Hypothetical protein, putative [Bodo saltans]|eukprot:CUG70025.1 Hypothetical protein, putative [Bodo saltans]
MPQKAPPAKKAAGAKSRSPSPATRGAAGKKSVGSSGIAPPSAPATKNGSSLSARGGGESVAAIQTFTTETALAFLQAVGRAYISRVIHGTDNLKHLAKKMEKETEERMFAHSRKERQRREKQRQLEKDAESKAQQKRRLVEALCVASFEGDVKEMQRLIEQERADAFTKDNQGNFPIGERPVNGQVGAIEYLIDRAGADPNARGEYDRTPLWRAAFNSHTDAIRALLARGADPRLRAQGQEPVELCSAEGKAVITSWDLKKTDELLTKQQTMFAERDRVRKAEAQAVSDTLTSSAGDLKTKLDVKQKELLHHKQEFEKRIVEYDIVNNDPTKAAELIKVALDCVKVAENDVTKTSEIVAALQEEYFALRTQIALHNHQELGDVIEGTEFPFKKLADVVFEDKDNFWKSSGKWPVIFDPSSRARTFLKYRNVIFVDTFSPKQMEPDSLRRSLLGALRYGKPLVLDLRDVPMLSLLEEKFNAILPNLFQEVLSKNFQEKEVFLKLLRQPQDGPELVEEKFSSVMAKEAKIVVVSEAIGVDEAFGARFVMLRVED